METETTSGGSSVRDEPLHLDQEKRLELIASPAENADDGPKKASPDEEEYEYVTGFKRSIIIISVTLVAFLMMLDMSIIVTVSHQSMVFKNDCYIFADADHRQSLV
jgi:hypothetical protein